MLDKIRANLSSLLTWLNAIGSLILAYALQNPDAFGELRDLLPESAKPWAPVVALLWFMLVQFAKAKALAAEQRKPVA